MSLISPPNSTKGLIDGRRLPRKGTRAVPGDVHTVFQTNAEFAVNGDHGLVAERHSRLQLQLIAAHQVGPLVNIEANAVTGPMRQARNLIIGSKSEIGDDFAR